MSEQPTPKPRPRPRPSVKKRPPPRGENVLEKEKPPESENPHVITRHEHMYETSLQPHSNDDSALYTSMHVPSNVPRIKQLPTRQSSSYYESMDEDMPQDIFELRKKLLDLIYKKAGEEEHKNVVKDLLTCNRDVNDKYRHLDFRKLLENNQVIVIVV